MAPLQPTDYYRAALDLLASGGAGQVTIDALCDALRVTKGSFYHHFAGRPDFIHQTLRYWEDVHGRSLADEALREPDARKRIRVLEDLAVGLNHEAERAIRELAATDDFADEVRRRVDAGRFAVVARTLHEAGLAPVDAERLADVGLALLVGAQETGATVDRARVALLLGQYRRWIEDEVARQG